MHPNFEGHLLLIDTDTNLRIDLEILKEGRGYWLLKFWSSSHPARVNELLVIYLFIYFFFL